MTSPRAAAAGAGAGAGVGAEGGARLAAGSRDELASELSAWFEAEAEQAGRAGAHARPPGAGQRVGGAGGAAGGVVEEGGEALEEFVEDLGHYGHKKVPSTLCNT